MCKGVVDLLVIAVASVILAGIFDGDDREDNEKWDHGDLFLKRLHNRNPIQQHQKQEIQVCSSAKTILLLLDFNTPVIMVIKCDSNTEESVFTSTRP